MELLSSAFGRFLFDGKEEAQAAGLTKTDMAKIRQARDILLRRMTEPPKLLELARMIGMNDFKLKAGFKEMFGTTLFGYLREKRLEKAYYLLQQESMSVTEACCEVGYSNPSYFAEAFREKYGINPGAFVRRRHCGEGSPSRPDFPSVR
ncbi:helix-turn-helix transcriptional regulator [Paenibacillus konkukensis]|uniref:helix-turn-helix transcriptional regulator n=1 Tax=Paenibacillus konkukensis TaxID=2020716 RepID=UPI0032E42738